MFKCPSCQADLRLAHKGLDVKVIQGRLYVTCPVCQLRKPVTVEPDGNVSIVDE